MKKEWQAINNAAKDWPQEITGLVLGDEGCIYRVLDESLHILRKKALAQGLTVRFLTPIVPNKHMEELFQRIQIYAQTGPIKVTFNDFGLLERCQDLVKAGKIIPAVGRILTRSILDCPWHDDLLQNEDPELVRACSGYTFSHEAKWKLLRQYGVQELEVNLREVGPIHDLRKSGFTLAAHCSNALISVGRICYTARWYNLHLPGCYQDQRCRQKLEIGLDKLWGKKRLMYEEPTEEMKEHFANLYVLGNVVYSPLQENIPTEVLKMFDTLIFTEQ